MIKKLLKYIKARLYLNETIVIYSLKNYQPQVSAATIKNVTNENINDILYFQPQRYIDNFKTFLSLGDKGYYAYLQHKCIHRSWVKGNQQIVTPHWAYPYKLKENEVFIHYCETAPEARGKNVYPHVLSYIVREHLNKDILISVNIKNIASKKGVEKVGFRERESKSAYCARGEVYQNNNNRELKVMIITMGLSRIVESILNAHNVVGIIECAPRKNKQTNNVVLYKIVKKLYSIFKNAKTLRTFARNKNIPYYYMDNGCDEAVEIWVKSVDPDVIVVYSMSQLLKKNIFDIPKYGTINLHPALLPSYRGPSPVFWMYYNAEKKGGVTVHYIDEGEDTGDIIYQEEFDIPLGMKLSDLNELICNLGTSLLLRALDNIDNLPRTKQPKKSPTLRARNIKPEEHKTIIEWNSWDLKRIWHLLRGTQSWLDAIEQPKGFYRGQRWQIEGYEFCDMSNFEPSKIYRENNQYFIACKDGKIFLSLRFNLKNFVLCMVGYLK